MAVVEVCVAIVLDGVKTHIFLSGGSSVAKLRFLALISVIHKFKFPSECIEVIVEK